MAVILTSNTQSEQEMREAIESRGFSTEAKETPDFSEVEGEKTSEQSEQPGETSGAAKTSESASASEAGEKKPQEAQSEKPEESSEKGKQRHNFKSKLEKLEDRAARLMDDLELERGGKKKLQEQLEEVQAQLAALKPAEPKKEEGPVRPLRPKKADYGFDDDKFDTALEKYEMDLEAYHAAVRQKEIDEAFKAREQENEQNRLQEEATKAFNTFVEKKDAGAALFEDWDELMEDPTANVDVDGPGREIIKLSIMHADSPADLIRHFMIDARDNGSADFNRILKMDSVSQARVLTRLEDKLVREREAGAPTKAAAEPPPADKKPPVKAAETKPEAPPAKPKPVAKMPSAPIEPVGSRSAGASPSLGKAMTALEYARLRGQGVNR